MRRTLALLGSSFLIAFVGLAACGDNPEFTSSPGTGGSAGGGAAGMAGSGGGTAATGGII
ncbi:MAG: branched-chain amino acid ABC transporter substrate-binding protein, partial [Sorangiineae bacterium PRO1]|nr:branched-chain amino acid ABC transporter substrate-binding protein [Sorangiineae bacterium PRO1]